MTLPAFDRMVESFAHEAARGARLRFRLGVVVPAAVVALVTAGATLAATGTVRIGSPVKVEPAPAGLTRLPGIAPGSERLATARAADPDGGPPWGVRTFRTEKGNLCAQSGRVAAGRLGVIGFDGSFHELPARTNLAACDIPVAGPPAAVRAIARDSAGRPTGAHITADGVFAPASTVRLDVNGLSTRLGCHESFSHASHGTLSPCDKSRFRYVAWGVLRPGVRALEVERVPGNGRVRRVAPSADRSFVFVLHGGDPRGARVRAVMASGEVLPVVRAGRQFTLPTGHRHPRLVRIAGARVTPASGTPLTTFALRWRVPLPARHQGDGWTYRLFGPGGQRCNVRLATTVVEPAGGIVPKRRAREGDEPVPPTRLLPQNGVRVGERVTRRFRPPGPPPRRWCPGSYRGEIRFGDRTIAGEFSFRVR